MHTESVRAEEKTVLLIFDDLERISSNVDFDLFLGTIESLMQAYKYVKVLFVANLSQFSDPQRAIWEKYSEKVVDHVFPIEDLATNISILETPERNAAALEFMKQHGSKNLRTLQKAHHFFFDVSQKIRQLDSDLLKSSDIDHLLCVACYAVVFESIEKIYEHEGQRLCEEASKSDAKEPSYQRIARELVYGDIESRICNKYLDMATTTDAKDSLVKGLVNYYLHGNDNIPIIIESLKNSKEIGKPPFYCSDEEVQILVAQQKERLANQDFTNLYQFLQIVDSIFVWGTVLGIDTSDIVLTAKKRIPELYEELDQPLSLNLYDDYLSSYKTKELLYSLELESEKAYYQNIVKTLSDWLDLKNYSKAFDVLLTMQQFIHRPTFLSAIDEETLFSVLCNDSLLPLGSCSEKQYYCAKIAYSIAMAINKDEYVGYLQSVKSRFSSDKMFLERMYQIEKAYEKEISG